MSEIILIPDEIILSKMYFIRGCIVMIDCDLAELYEVETHKLDGQVRQNPGCFPEDFMFRLTEPEFETIRSQLTTLHWNEHLKLPLAFTEHGVLMLSSVLKSERTIMVNIHIMRIFIRMREMLTDNLSVRLEIEKIKKRLNDELFFRHLDKWIEKHETPKPDGRISPL